ncbi:DUF4387 domain-containing protein [Novosphingobium sp. MD-1]|uniref:DUF4387 domain-containing protein n=1 Tax=Novosphingobium sp. MD-1 TaxID=1630648 RepID=UPI00061BE19A|nr:DUF4387 domain-containing protein [Novosphingobium sp. MD-1]GAO53286.1 hypothetical protein NMD1_00292 [Novosphingobium sp. MD-1]
MATVNEVCRLVRSKNAGPYWVTVDFFFKDAESYARYARSPALGGDTFARLFGADPALVKYFPVDSLHVLKVSYPRTSPQGGEVERDMHCGQQYVRLLDIELD